MTNKSASTFPSHKYDFGDCVSVLPLQESGVVEAIAYQRHDDTWHYRLTDLSHEVERWWNQDELEPACLHHSNHRHEDSDRYRCGLSPQNATESKP